MTKHVFFDMDGTLTPSRQHIELAVATRLVQLAKQVDVVVVSGASMPQMRAQLELNRPTYMAQNGNDTAGIRASWRNELTWTQKLSVLALIKHMIIGKQFDPARLADLVEDRGCQVSFSGTGHHAPLAEKRAYDVGGKLRRQRIQDDMAWFAELSRGGVKWAIGGTTCIDFYTHTKGENVARYVGEMGWIPMECLYVGDALFEGGNDATVKGVIPTRQVSGPNEAMAVMHRLLSQDAIDWEEIKRMKPVMRVLAPGRYEASVGTGFETCWWPTAEGATEEEAVSNLQKVLAKI